MFQSTHPVWGATWRNRTWDILAGVSIHAPRVGCDQDISLAHVKQYIVSIHAPRVGCDLLYQGEHTKIGKFQSTHPVWGATCKQNNNIYYYDGFNPRTPCGVRLLTKINFVDW